MTLFYGTWQGREQSCSFLYVTSKGLLSLISALGYVVPSMVRKRGQCGQLTLRPRIGTNPERHVPERCIHKCHWRVLPCHLLSVTAAYYDTEP